MSTQKNSPAPSPTQPPEKFQFSVSDKQIQDLQSRLKQTRWPSQLNNVGWSYGVPLDLMKDIAEYWQGKFDLKAQIKRINSFPQFRASVHGKMVHFIHAKSSRQDALPLILIHGWPGSFIEFLDMIPLLTEPEEGKQAFHVVVPSLPGYGFSEVPTEPGFDTEQMARLLNGLMIKLGYIKYLAQGGDWGSFVSRQLAVNHKLNCVGIHVNMAVVTPPLTVWNIPRLLCVAAGQTWLGFSQPEAKWIDDTMKFIKEGTAYQKLHTTNPQTPAYALNDSPVGLLAWILEKFYYWSDHDGDLKKTIPYDAILTNVCIYWFTETIASSMRLYKEELGVSFITGTQAKAKNSPITIPVGCAIFPKEIYKVPRAWVEHVWNVQHYEVFEKGGHFAALEQPKALAEDIQKCFGTWIRKHIVQF